MDLQKIFLSGKIPNPNLDGLYSGTFYGKKVSWRGKKLNAINSTGINLFNDGKGGTIEKYPFKTHAGKGVKDKNLDVLKIDYNMPENPFWVRPILDELVEVKPGEYLGKMHVKILPGVYISVLYFELKK